MTCSGCARGVGRRIRKAARERMSTLKMESNSWRERRLVT
jgi:hypothetical protein